MALRPVVLMRLQGMRIITPFSVSTNNSSLLSTGAMPTTGPVLGVTL